MISLNYMATPFVLIAWYLASFLFSLLLSPLVLKILNKVKGWEKSIGRKTVYDTVPSESNKIENLENSQKIPRMGGIVFVVVMLICLLSIFLIYKNAFVVLALAGIVFFAALIGICDDLLNVLFYPKKNLPYRIKILLVFIAGVVFSGTLYSLFGFDTLTLGIVNTFDLNLGWLLPIFAGLWIAGWFTTSPIDGIDSLAATVLQVAFMSLGIMFALDGGGWVIYASICFAAAGSLTAFHWFNITPAKFFFTEVGMAPALVLFASLAYISGVSGGEGIAFSLFAGIMLLVTLASIIIQVIGYQLFSKKRIFLIAPIHHQFQVSGMSDASIVSRYFIIAVFFAMLGLLLSS